MSATPDEIPTDLVPDEPSIADISDEDYAHLLHEIAKAEPDEERTGH